MRRTTDVSVFVSSSKWKTPPSPATIVISIIFFTLKYLRLIFHLRKRRWVMDPIGYSFGNLVIENRSKSDRNPPSSSTTSTSVIDSFIGFVLSFSRWLPILFLLRTLLSLRLSRLERDLPGEVQRLSVLFDV